MQFHQAACHKVVELGRCARSDLVHIAQVESANGRIHLKESLAIGACGGMRCKARRK